MGFGQAANFFIAGTRITKLGMHNLKPFHSLVEVLYNVAALDHYLLFLVHVNELIELCLQCSDTVGWAAGRASGL